MSNRIIILGNEPELVRLANAINRTYCAGGADVIMYNDTNIAQKTSSDNLYLIGHANAQDIGDYDFPGLKKDFGDHLKGAKAVYLAGCSTSDEVAQILNGGFVPMSLAKNVKVYTNGAVYGTPGVLVLDRTAGDPGVLKTITSLASGYNANSIFVPA